jgi:DNA-binding beta-propeller fold protein YncE
VSSEKDNKLMCSTRGQAQGAIDVCKRPRHMMFSPTGRKIYVCCGNSNELGVVDRPAARWPDTRAAGRKPRDF